MKRIFYASIGFVATGLGLIGVWIPGMPTTVFMLVALWAFGHVSPRLESWLQRIPFLKQALREAARFQQDGTVKKSSKYISQVCAWTSFLALVIVLPQPLFLLASGLLACSCSLFMWWVPTAQESQIIPAAHRQLAASDRRVDQ